MASTLVAMASTLVAMASTLTSSNGLHPSSDGLQPNGDGVHPIMARFGDQAAVGLLVPVDLPIPCRLEWTILPPGELGVVPIMR